MAHATAPTTSARIVTAVAVAALAASLAACTSAAPTAGPTAPTVSPRTSTTPTRNASSSPAPTSPRATRSSGVAAKTPSPAPSVAGPLSSKTVPTSILSFTANNQAKAAEGEFNPNGTFVHQVNPADASLAALPGCGPEPANLPKAQYALAAAYLDSATQQVGNLIQLRFPTSQQAATWLATFQTDVKHCPTAGIKPVVTSRTVQDQRDSVGVTWSEAGTLNNQTVTLVALQGTHDPRTILAELQKWD